MNHRRLLVNPIAGARDPYSRPQDYRARLHMLEANETAVQMLLSKYTTRGGIPDVAVLVVDFRDELGQQLAEVFDPEHQAERMAGANMIPTALLVIARPVLARGLESSHPRTAAALRSPMPPGRVTVGCISSGGITLLGMPIRSMPAETSA